MQLNRGNRSDNPLARQSPPGWRAILRRCSCRCSITESRPYYPASRRGRYAAPSHATSPASPAIPPTAAHASKRSGCLSALQGLGPHAFGSDHLALRAIDTAHPIGSWHRTAARAGAYLPSRLTAWGCPANYLSRPPPPVTTVPAIIAWELSEICTCFTTCSPLRRILAKPSAWAA